jgi:hypothetical protein
LADFELQLADTGGCFEATVHPYIYKDNCDKLDVVTLYFQLFIYIFLNNGFLLENPDLSLPLEL